MMNFNKQKRSDGLFDHLGRQITYLRISLTSKCNLRCKYCYGSDNYCVSQDKELSVEEICDLIKVFVSLGIDKIRFTGGEPLTRHNVVDLVRWTASQNTIFQIGLTTNGLALNRYLDSLVEAGLNRLNVSLDTLNRNTFRKITGVDGFDQVYAGIKRAVKCGIFERVKINTVIMRGINDHEIPDFARWGICQKVDLRFIEYMPTLQITSGDDLFVSEEEIKDKIGFELEEINTDTGSSGPAVSYRYRDYPGRISFISAVSRSFCDECNRIRLTSTGELIGCLFRKQSFDLGEMLRNSDTIDEITAYVRDMVLQPEFRRTPESVSIGECKPFMRGVGG